MRRSVDPEVLGKAAVRLLADRQVDQRPQGQLGIAGRQQGRRALHHITGPDEMIPTAVLIAVRLAPRDGRGRDEGAGVRLILVGEDDADAGVIAVPSVARHLLEVGGASCLGGPLLHEPLALLLKGQPERLKERRRRVVEIAAEGQAQRERLPAV